MEDFSLRGENVLLPLPFHMDQRPAPLTERQLGESRQRKEIVFGVHEFGRQAKPLISVTPAGRESWTGSVTT